MVKVILMVTLAFCYDVDNAGDVGANLYNKTLLPHPSISKMSECRGWPKTESWKYIYWFHTNTWKGHSKQSTENYLCLIFAKRICPSCNLYFCWVLIIRIWSLSPCWPIPGCPIQSSQKSSDPQLFPRHTALRCCEITHYVQIQNMKKRKYRKSTHSNPQHLTEQNTLEGPEQKILNANMEKCIWLFSILKIFVQCANLQNGVQSTAYCANSLGQRVDQRWCEAPDRTGQACCLRLLFQEIGFPPNPSNP